MKELKLNLRPEKPKEALPLCLFGHGRTPGFLRIAFHLNQLELGISLNFSGPFIFVDTSCLASWVDKDNGKIVKARL